MSRSPSNQNVGPNHMLLLLLLWTRTTACRHQAAVLDFIVFCNNLQQQGMQKLALSYNTLQKLSKNNDLGPWKDLGSWVALEPFWPFHYAVSTRLVRGSVARPFGATGGGRLGGRASSKKLNSDRATLFDPPALAVVVFYRDGSGTQFSNLPGHTSRHLRWYLSHKI